MSNWAHDKFDNKAAICVSCDSSCSNCWVADDEAAQMLTDVKNQMSEVTHFNMQWVHVHATNWD